MVIDAYVMVLLFDNMYLFVFKVDSSEAGTTVNVLLHVAYA